MLLLPETLQEKKMRVVKAVALVIAIAAVLGTQTYKMSLATKSAARKCEMQMQNASAVSNCDKNKFCLVTTEQGITFRAQDPKIDELIPVEVCDKSRRF